MPADDRGFAPTMKVDARVLLALLEGRTGEHADDLRKRAQFAIKREHRRLEILADLRKRGV